MEEMLLRTAGNGDIAGIESLINHGLELNDTPLSGKALQLAVTKARKRGGAIDGRQTDVVKLLLKHGSKVEGSEDDQYTPLLSAAQMGAAEIVKALLDAGANPLAQWQNKSALLIATQSGNVDTVNAFLSFPNIFNEDTRSEVFQYISLNWSINFPRAPMFKALCTTGVSLEALNFALPRIMHSGFRAYDEKGYTILDSKLDGDLAESLKVMLDAGADPNIMNNKLGQTTLHGLAWCTEGGESLSLMLKRGADPNLRGSAGQSDGRTALQMACRVGNLISISLLLQNGADSTIQDDKKNTLLHLAAKRGSLQIVKLLAQISSFDILLSRNTTGETPFHIAASTGNLEVVQFFYDQGADINDSTPAGWTPLLYSLGSHFIWETQTVTSYLLDHGADARAQCAGGWTALHILIQFAVNKHAPVLKEFDVDFRLLVERGADINAKATSGDMKSRFTLNPYQEGYLDLLRFTAPESLVSDETPLHWAAGYGSSHHVRLLLSLGADIEARDSTGATPLIRAIKDIKDDAVCPEIVIELLRHGADEWAQDASGLHARDWSLKKRLFFDWKSRSIPEAASGVS